MAYAIKRSMISDEDVLLIRKMLVLQPKSKNNKYNRDKATEPIIFYHLEDDVLHLPYIFAGNLFKITPNIDIKYPRTFLTFNGTLRDYQIPVEMEAWQQLTNFGTTTLGLYPGFGKTILGACLASRAKLLTVVMVHRELLAGQWKKTFVDNTNAKVWIVGEKDIPASCDVIICMDTRWIHVPKEMRDAVGFLIIDEAHAFCTPSRMGALLAFHPIYIVIESGSLTRDDGMEDMIYALAGTHGVFRESNKPFSITKVITGVKPERKMNRLQGVDYLHLQKTTLFNERRNNIIVELVIKNLKNKILILTALKDHAMLLYNNLTEINVSCDFLCGGKKGYHDSNVLIGTISKIGTGFDPATSCPDYKGSPFDLLLVVSSIKKEDMLIQNIGRIFRADFPSVLHFVDDDEIYKSHWYAARKWYLSRNGTISEYKCPTNTPDIKTIQEQWLTEQVQQHKKLTLNVIKK